MLAVSVSAVLSGCGTILNGGSQPIAINTVPAGATCSIERDGYRIGSITATPGVIDVSRSRRPLTVLCDKLGYAPVVGTVDSIASGIIFGNVLFGGPVGMIVDFSTGSNYDYHETVFIRFEPIGTALPLRSS